MTERLTPLEPKETPGILRIGVDLDGIVINPYKIICQKLKEKLGVEIDPFKGIRSYYLTKWPEIAELPDGPKIVLDLFTDPEIYLLAEPVTNAIPVLNALRNQGHQILFITARNHNFRGLTEFWFEQHGLAWAKAQTLFQNTEKDDRANWKAQIAETHNLHILIDDHAPTMKSVTTKSMFVKILISYPWNKEEDVGAPSIFVNGWEEIFLVVQNLSCWHYFLHT